MSNSKVAEILARIAASKKQQVVTTAVTTPTVTYSNESLQTLRLHIAAYYIMHRTCSSKQYVQLQKYLCESTHVLGYGSQRKVNSRLVGLVMFGLETNVELWEVLQNIFYSFTEDEQHEIVKIIRTNYGEIMYD